MKSQFCSYCRHRKRIEKTKAEHSKETVLNKQSPHCKVWSFNQKQDFSYGLCQVTCKKSSALAWTSPCRADLRASPAKGWGKHRSSVCGVVFIQPTQAQAVGAVKRAPRSHMPLLWRNTNCKPLSPPNKPLLIWCQKKMIEIHRLQRQQWGCGIKLGNWSCTEGEEGQPELDAAPFPKSQTWAGRSSPANAAGHISIPATTYLPCCSKKEGETWGTLQTTASPASHSDKSSLENHRWGHTDTHTQEQDDALSLGDFPPLID